MAEFDRENELMGAGSSLGDTPEITFRVTAMKVGHIYNLRKMIDMLTVPTDGE